MRIIHNFLPELNKRYFCAFRRICDPNLPSSCECRRQVQYFGEFLV
jgi:hypothetical protein